MSDINKIGLAGAIGIGQTENTGAATKTQTPPKTQKPAPAKDSFTTSNEENIKRLQLQIIAGIEKGDAKAVQQARIQLQKVNPQDIKLSDETKEDYQTKILDTLENINKAQAAILDAIKSGDNSKYQIAQQELRKNNTIRGLYKEFLGQKGNLPEEDAFSEEKIEHYATLISEGMENIKQLQSKLVEAVKSGDTSRQSEVQEQLTKNAILLRINKEFLNYYRPKNDPTQNLPVSDMPLEMINIYSTKMEECAAMISQLETQLEKAVRTNDESKIQQAQEDLTKSKILYDLYKNFAASSKDMIRL